MSSQRSGRVGRISIRHGIGFSDEPEVTGHPDRHRRLVLFIHGYANSERVATRSYRRMLANLAQQSAVSTTLLKNVFLFYWPGDLALPAISQASYPYQVGRATTAGEALADFLAGLAARGGPTEVVMVAHSLGTRVALTAARQLHRQRGRQPEVLALLLMAGAVPEGEFVGEEAAFGRLEGTLGRPLEIILFSGHDWVLRYTFPLGQTFRVDQVARPLLPRAIGYRGGPALRWRSEHRFDMGPFGHSDYWKRGSAADRVAGLFGKAPVRQLSGRPFLEWVLAPEKQLKRRLLEDYDTFDY